MSPVYVDPEANAALSQALRDNRFSDSNEAALRQALSRGADPNGTMNSLGRGHEGGFSYAPFLLWAAGHRQGLAVQLLLEAGAHPDAPRLTHPIQNFRSPLSWAIRHQQPQIRDALLAAGARLDVLSADGRPLMMEVLEYGNADDARVLTEQGLNWEASFPKPASPLHWAELPDPQHGWAVLLGRVHASPNEVVALSQWLYEHGGTGRVPRHERQAFVQQLHQRVAQAAQDVARFKAKKYGGRTHIEQARDEGAALDVLVRCCEAAWLRQEIAQVTVVVRSSERPRL